MKEEGLKGVEGRVLPRERPEEWLRKVSLCRKFGDSMAGAGMLEGWGWPRSREGVTAGVCGRERS